MSDSANTIGSGTVEGALEYLEFLVNKGHVQAGAVTALKTGFTKVMKIVNGEGWEQVEVRSIDIEDHMLRFGNMTHGQYNAKSLADYGSRVKKVITWYLEFLAHPGWTPPVKSRALRGQKLSASSSAAAAPSDDGASTPRADATRPDETQNVAAPKTNLVAFPFPLADGTLASLYLPTRLSSADAKRMARFVETLVVEEGVSNVETA